MRQPSQKRRRGERGASSVEFAMTVIPLLMILGGIFNFGVAFSQKLALDNAVRETARSAAVDTGKSTSDLASDGVTTFNESAIARQGEVATLTVSSCKGTLFGTSTVATGKFNSKFMFPWLLPGIPTEIAWESRGEYVCEYS